MQNMLAERRQNQKLLAFELPKSLTPTKQDESILSSEDNSSSAKVDNGFKNGTRNAFGVLMTASKRQQEAKKNNSFSVLMSAAKRKAQTEKRIPYGPKKRGVKSWRRRTSTRVDSRRVPSCKLIPTKPRPIVVDGFQFATPSLSSMYFLSHFHSDHYIGLQKNFCSGLIFCSAKTRELAILRLGVNPQRIISLPLNKRVCLAPYDETLNVESVVLLDANHCPGACTFIFRLQNGKAYWHTGDFRFQTSMLMHPALLEFVPSSSCYCRQLETLFLDTTYCDPKYDFPSQRDAIDAVIRTMEPSWKRNKETCYFFGTYTIGKEKVFLEAARHFDSKVCILDPGKRKILKIALGNEVFQKFVTHTTNDTHDCRMFVVSMASLSFERIGQILNSLHEDKEKREKRKTKDSCVQVDLMGNKVASRGNLVELMSFTRAMAFRPTGWSHNSTTRSRTGEQKEKRQRKLGRDGSLRNSTKEDFLKLSTLRKVIDQREIYKVSVPYSEHSSFSELRDCVKRLNPKRVSPTVGAYSKRAEMTAMLRR